MDTPCKECITYGMCRSQLIECLPEQYEIQEDKYVAFIVALAFYRYLEIKCCLIGDYVSKAKAEKGILNDEKHDELIYDILCEAFKL